MSDCANTTHIGPPCGPDCIFTPTLAELRRDGTEYPDHLRRPVEHRDLPKPVSLLKPWKIR